MLQLIVGLLMMALGGWGVWYGQLVARQGVENLRKQQHAQRDYQYKFFDVKGRLPDAVVLYEKENFLKELERGKRSADRDLNTMFHEETALDKGRRINDYVFRSYQDIWKIQKIWFQERGRYFQGKATMSVVPDYKNDEKVELGFGPSDQIDDWRSVGYADEYAPVQLRCDVYEGPQGHGFIVTSRMKIDGGVWKNQLHHGAEARGIQNYRWVKEK